MNHLPRQEYEFFTGLKDSLQRKLLLKLNNLYLHAEFPENWKGEFIAALENLGINELQDSATLFDCADTESVQNLEEHPFEGLIDRSLPLGNNSKLNQYVILVIILSILLRARRQSLYDAALKNACRSARLLAKEPNTLAKLPRLSFDLDVDLGAVSALLDNAHTPKEVELRLQPFRPILRYVIEYKTDPSRSRSSQQFGDQKCRTISDIYHLYDEEITIEREVPNVAEKNSGVSAEEVGLDQPVSELFTNIPEENGNRNLSRSQQLVLQKDKKVLAHILRRICSLSSDVGHRPVELIRSFTKCAVSDLYEIQAENVKGNFDRAIEFEDILFKLLSLVANKSEKLLRTFQLFKKPEDVEEFGFYFDHGQAYLVTKPRIKSGKVNLKYIVGCHEKISRIFECIETKPLVLAMPKELSGLLLHYFGNVKSLIDGKLVPQKKGQVLSGLSEKGFKPLTQYNLAQYLTHHYIEEGVDTVVRSYLAGDGPGKAAGQYYTQLETSFVQSIFNKAMAHLGLTSSDSSAFSDNLVGTALLTRDAYNSGRLTTLKKAVKRYESQKYGANAYQFHNYYTLYVYIILCLATGHRAVSAPFELLTDFNLDTGIVLISDEDVSDNLQPRPILLGKIAHRQIKKYEEYLRKWARLAGPYDQVLARVLKDMLSGKLPTFFLFDEEGKKRVLDPANLVAYREHTNPIPLNWARHFLRSFLTGKVAGEDIDSFMGHTNYNQSPTNIGAGSDLSYLEPIASLINSKIKDLGGEAI